MNRFVKTQTHGAFSKLRKVTKGIFKNHAWKKTKPFSKEDAKKTREITREYLTELKNAGINVLDTKIQITSQEKSRIHFLQELVPKENILQTYLKKSNNTQAIKLAKQMKTMHEKINIYNKQNKNNNIGIDFKLDNFAFINGKVYLIDIFPPLLKKEKNFILNISKKTIAKSKYGIWQRILGPFSKILINHRINDLFDSQKMQKRLYKRFSKEKPHLKKQFYDIFIKQQN